MKPIEHLDEADKITKAIDHLIYINFPIIKSKKILTLSLEELKKAFAYSINAILQYEYLKKRIYLYKDPSLNFKVFSQKCAKEYSISTEEVQKIKNLFQIIKIHKESSVEFIKENKLIIITDHYQKIIKLEEIKEYIALSKKLIRYTRYNLLGKI